MEMNAYSKYRRQLKNYPVVMNVTLDINGVLDAELDAQT